ncbi:MAG: FAD-dependent oxidoreductase [Candidatus Saccharibacteria bacterium]|nr:FAD-dependent oxidoreductase [Candidatus Saccharibacteria bacterium]
MALMSDKVVIIGAGPSALTAAIYLTREDVTTTLYERGVVGGMAAITDQIDNYPGFAEGVTGMKLAGELQKQAERFGADIQYGEATSLKAIDGGVEVVIDGKPVQAGAVLLATGSNHRKLGVPGEDELYGRGVHYCATCDGAFYRDRRLIVVGGGNSAVQEAMFLTRYATHIDLLVRSKLRASEVLQKELQKYVDEGKITVHIGATTDEIIVNDGTFYGVRSTQDGEEKEFTADALFVFIGLIPNTQFLQDSAIELDGAGHIITDEHLRTSVPGVFASGDVRSGATMQIASAVGEGAEAALQIREYLQAKAREE